MSEMEARKKRERERRLTNRLSTRVVNEDEERVATFDETVPSADARRGHLTRERYKAVTCLNDFKFLSIKYVYRINKHRRWQTSHVRVRSGEGWCIVVHVPYTGRHLSGN
jgi:hypothetical protein